MICCVFNSCEQDVGFSNQLKSAGTTPAPGPTPSPTPIPGPAPTPGDVKATCQAKSHLAQNMNVSFPDPRVTCAWNMDGNLGPRNEYFQARIEQAADLSLPAGATVCGMTFSFPTQQYLYDDHFLLTFNGLVLASSFDFSNVLQAQGQGLLVYDWSRMAGMVWDHGREGVFCAGVSDSTGPHNGTCDWPHTDTAGSIRMEFPPEVFYATMAHDPGRQNHGFKFVSIGDNDDRDCEHSDIHFTLSVEYVVP
jgi:hypothetical protein